MSWIMRTFETWYCASHGGWYEARHFTGTCVRP